MFRDEAYFLDILIAAKLAVSYVMGKTKETFLEDTVLQDAVIRRLEIIGEATRRISDATKEGFPNFPWRMMVATRNALIHEYDDIDLETVWDTVLNDLPPLIVKLEKIVSLEE
jgi:uncharacterized protein with HEPN domain